MTSGLDGGFHIPCLFCYGGAWLVYMDFTKRLLNADPVINNWLKILWQGSQMNSLKEGIVIMRLIVMANDP
jgi:hypothetical protein